jgi:hypothetical protein
VHEHQINRLAVRAPVALRDLLELVDEQRVARDVDAVAALEGAIILTTTATATTASTTIILAATADAFFVA